MSDEATVDRAALQALLTDIDPAIMQLLPSYVANRHADIEVLDRSLGESDMVVLRRLGHNLKGSGAAYGLPPVSEIGAGIEAAAKREALDEIRVLRGKLEALVMELDSILVEMK